MSMSHACRISGAAFELLVSTTVLAASQIDPNIERVEAGLLPIAAEKIGVPANIRDRMRAYGVPGVSIAVINDGRIARAKGYGVADSPWLQFVNGRDGATAKILADDDGSVELLRVD